jgi:glycolate oxidase
VLPDGTLLETGHRTVKGVTGYDLTALFIGSEGTLGVVVRATVRVLPRPSGDRVTIGALFPDVASAATASAAITSARLRPSVMELLDTSALEVIREYAGEETMRAALGPSSGGSYLLVQFDDSTSVTVADRAVRLIEAAGGSARLSTDAATGELLLAIRRSFHSAMAAHGEVLIEDVSVPRSRMREMFGIIDEISRKHGIPIPTVAHAGDGNLHPNFAYRGDRVPDEVWSAADEMFRAALSLGGTLTGEHGVGLLKRRWLRDELGDTGFELQRRIKAVFDPKGLMNPGKVFD